MLVGLKSAGYAVDVFNDPVKALSEFESGQSRKYSLIFSDIRTPGISGFEFASRVNAIDREIKIVLITAFGVKKEEFDNVLPALGIDALLNKPIRRTRLNDIAEALLSDSKPHEVKARLCCWTSIAGVIGKIAIRLQFLILPAFSHAQKPLEGVQTHNKDSQFLYSLYLIHAYIRHNHRVPCGLEFVVSCPKVMGAFPLAKKSCSSY